MPKTKRTKGKEERPVSYQGRLVEVYLTGSRPPRVSYTDVYLPGGMLRFDEIKSARWIGVSDPEYKQMGSDVDAHNVSVPKAFVERVKALQRAEDTVDEQEEEVRRKLRIEQRMQFA